jgi:hypothetical protein
VSRYKAGCEQVTSHGTQGLKTGPGAVAVQAITNLSWVQERFAKTVTNLLILLSVLGAALIYLIFKIL